MPVSAQYSYNVDGYGELVRVVGACQIRSMKQLVELSSQLKFFEQAQED